METHGSRLAGKKREQIIYENIHIFAQTFLLKNNKQNSTQKKVKGLQSLAKHTNVRKANSFFVKSIHV